MLIGCSKSTKTTQLPWRSTPKAWSKVTSHVVSSGCLMGLRWLVPLPISIFISPQIITSAMARQGRVTCFSLIGNARSFLWIWSISSGRLFPRCWSPTRHWPMTPTTSTLSCLRLLQWTPFWHRQRCPSMLCNRKKHGPTRGPNCDRHGKRG